MFVEIVPLQYEFWLELMRSTQRLGEVRGVPQTMYFWNKALGDYSEFNFELDSQMANGGGGAAYRCAQLFCLEQYLTYKYEDLPKIVTGFWFNFRLEFKQFRDTLPQGFQKIPEIGLTLLLDFGIENHSSNVTKAVVQNEMEKGNGEFVLLRVSKGDWKEKILDEIENRFGAEIETSASSRPIIAEETLSQGGDNSDIDTLDKDVPF